MVGKHAAADLGESALMPGLNVFGRDNRNTLWSLKGLAQLTRTKLKYRRAHVLRIGESRDRVRNGSQGQLANYQIELFRQVIERLVIRLADGRSQLVGDVVCCGADFFIEDGRLNAAANLVERFGVGLFAI